MRSSGTRVCRFPGVCESHAMHAIHSARGGDTVEKEWHPIPERESWLLAGPIPPARPPNPPHRTPPHMETTQPSPWQADPVPLPPAGSRIVVAMSGGVDSAVAALLLREAGYDVVGVNLRVWEYDSCHSAEKSCCSPEDIEDARRVGMQIDIPFYVLRMEGLFQEKVIDRFILDYRSGRTPNPCVECNTHVKFGALFQKARDLGIEYIATGHYAGVGRLKNGRYAVLPGEDTTKNQAYYLYGLSQEALAHTIFPLACMTKTHVREIARRHGLPVAAKAESQEICFIPENDYRSFLERRGVPMTPGFFRDLSGRVLGKHAGKERFTVGQRKGLGIAFSEPLYVLRIEEGGDVILGTASENARQDFRVEQVECMGLDPEQLRASSSPIDVRVQVRYRTAPVSARVVFAGETSERLWNGRPAGLRLQVHLERPAPSITPGQSAVFFPPTEDGDAVLMGGLIARD